MLVISNPLHQLLIDHHRRSRLTGPEDFVFCREDGATLDPDNLRRCCIYPAFRLAGIPIIPLESGCHVVRHLAGSSIHRQTGNLRLAQTQLGYSNVSTTGDIYTHVDEE